MFRKVLVAAVAVGALSSCTFAQLATIEQLRGPISETDKAVLEAMPDVPLVIDNQVLQLDGTLTPIPEEMMSARQRFDLAVSRTGWATRPDLIPKLWCIVGRETGGTYFQRAHNGRGNDNSYGWLQINMKGRLGPARMEAFGLSSYEDLFDPDVNLAVGWGLFEAAGWSPWASTHRPC